MKKVVRTSKTTSIRSAAIPDKVTAAATTNHQTAVKGASRHHVEKAIEMPSTKRKSRADIKKQRKIKDSVVTDTTIAPGGVVVEQAKIRKCKSDAKVKSRAEKRSNSEKKMKAKHIPAVLKADTVSQPPQEPINKQTENQTVLSLDIPSDPPVLVKKVVAASRREKMLLEPSIAQVCARIYFFFILHAIRNELCQANWRDLNVVGRFSFTARSFFYVRKRDRVV